MSNNFERLFIKNEEIYNHIVDLLVFLNVAF